MFASAHLLQYCTSWYLFPHIIRFNPKSVRWEARNSSSWKLIPFYFTNTVILVGVLVTSLLLQIFKYISGSNSKVSGNVFGIYLFAILGSTYGWGLNLPSFRNAPRMVEYMNAIVCFEEELLPKKTEPIPSNQLVQTFIRLFSNGEFE